MPQIKRSGPPAQESRPAHNTVSTDSIPGTDVSVDLELVGGINADLWSMLFDGTFRLAVPCKFCGRSLTAGASKIAGVGPKCAARVVTE